MDADGNFDVLVLGTGLTESITAAALSKAGFKVVHLDVNPYYGADEASLTLDELARWADSRAHPDPADPNPSPYLLSQRETFKAIHRSLVIPEHARHYSVSLSPSLLTSVGPLITSLVSSGVSRYGGYRLLERVGIYDREVGIRSVPASKEDIFKSQEMTLLEKRRLMRFFMFASSDFEGVKELEGHEETGFVEYLQSVFSLRAQVSDAIAYALAFCSTAAEPTLPVLQRLRRYLRSSGRYGASPFLVGHYGGSGEIAQGFCRVSAVNGGVYILDRPIQSITPPHTQPIASSPVSEKSLPGTAPISESKYTIMLKDVPEPLTADIIISSPSQLPPGLRDAAHLVSSTNDSPGESFARCIAILDRPIPFPPPPATPDVSSSGDPAKPEGSSDRAASEGEEAAKPVDTAVLVFPPSSLDGGSSTAAVHAFITGQGTMSAPQGKYILYLSIAFSNSEKSPESQLKPYLDAILSLISSSDDGASTAEALFKVFYIQHPHQTPTLATTGAEAATALLIPSVSTALTETADASSVAAEAVFFKAVEILKAKHPEAWSPRDSETKSGSGGDVFEEIAFFPPTEFDDAEDAGEEW
ncbi:FAD/NAD(P)-binding domain-containing protein [Auriscalpium vulgare]|uniref:FAD/NAD(P)-binding domain-containing protein n=1 Tax=Auriscalpium vulgare TaxID=40419 RepID=A0ACB8S863_9AGAM|nr:FAD/NAD(P)-binding domain-containing protein [Auriscalpium vulgare]